MYMYVYLDVDLYICVYMYVHIYMYNRIYTLLCLLDLSSVMQPNSSGASEP